MKTKNLPLIVGIALPIILIAIISLVIFLPSLSVKPAHDFIYTSGDANYDGYSRYYRNSVQVGKDGRIVLKENPIPNNPQNYLNEYIKADTPTLYRYDVRTASSHQISLTEAQALVLDPGPSSPDGYTIQYDYGHDGLFELFGSGNRDSGLYIGKGSAKKGLTGMAEQGRYYSNNFNLVGWIK